MIRLAAAALLAVAAAPSPGAAAHRGIGLSAAPARIRLVGATTAAVTLRNPGSRPVAVVVSRARLALSLRGKPRIALSSGARAPEWLIVRPRRISVPRGRSVRLLVTTKPGRAGGPGDHSGVVLLTTRPLAQARVRIRLRVGIVVVLHVPGRIVRRLQPLGLRVRRSGGGRLLELRLANRGNVSEALGAGRLRLVLLSGGDAVARVRPRPRALLPGGVGIVDFVYRGSLRGAVAARVEIRLRPHGPVVASRLYRLRL